MRRSNSALAALLVVLSVSTPALTDPPGTTGKREKHPRTADETASIEVPAPQPGGDTAGRPAGVVTAADVADAPRPDRAGGVVRDEAPGPGRAMLWIPRVALAVPRLALEVVDAPVRGGLWVYETYQVKERFADIFFNDERTVGLYPLAFWETGLGLNAGARFVHRDLFGEHEKLRLRASFGGRYRQIYALVLESGQRFGDRFGLELEAGYEVRPNDRFFGIGNLDEVPPGDVTAPADPRELAVASHFQEDLGKVAVIAVPRITDTLSARLTGAYLYSAFKGEGGDFASDESIDTLYQVDDLVGFDQGVSSLYLEAELRLDTRHAATRYEPLPSPGGGWVVGPFVGAAAGLADDPSRYLRYGLDLQHYIRIAAGPRVIALRAYLEGVVGDRDRVPFSQLPRLGGSLLLRGYEANRFRDRALALVTAEYQFDLSANLSGVLFADAGRVSPTLPDVADDLGSYRLGYGAAIQAHTGRSFMARASIASSIDGGLFLSLAFDTIYDPKARIERK